MRQAIELCRNTFDRCVEIRTVLPEKDVMVSADPTQIEQVVLNLLVNAFHAMTIMRPAGQQAQGGVLTISVCKASAGEPPRSCPDASAWQYWKMCVADTGVGMDSGVLDKIFDPFFTTKGPEQGTGLGLAMVSDIVMQHGGCIDVQSEPGAGTAFDVYLPAAVQAAPSLKAPSVEPVCRGEGLVLIADDDVMARNVLKVILDACGYVVLSVEDGVQALEFFTMYSGDVKAVMLDLIMPRKSCKDTFLALKAVNPLAPVIVMSGVAKDARIDELIRLGVKGFIEKPMTVEKVGRMLHDVMSSKS